MLHITNKYSILLYTENLHKTNNATIYSIVSTNYYIVNLTNEFYSWSCEMQSKLLQNAKQANLYYGLISAPQNIHNQCEHE